MREIKFRAWDEDNKIMYYSENDGEDNGEGSIYWYFAFGQPRFSEPQLVHRIISELEDVDEKIEYRTPNQTLMQYTGLKDRTGKEIYEGDIVTIGEQKKMSLFVVKYGEHIDIAEAGYANHSNLGFFVYKKTFQCGLLNEEILDDWKGIEVIGNIYENPELLK